MTVSGRDPHGERGGEPALCARRLPGTFEVLGRDPASRARAGVLHTRAGAVPTPVFMPVGTQGAIKAAAPEEVRALGARIILANTYHLHVRPGEALIRELGGLHGFMGWEGAILTDSGGFQVFSLAKLRKVTEEGVEFRNHVDGGRAFLSPESAMQIQQDLGSDIAMVLDECPPYPCSYDEAARSWELTLRWAKRCLAWWRGQEWEPAAKPLIFGIAQGGVHPELRKQAAEAVAQLGFDGCAIGGVSVGEPEEEMMLAVEHCAPWLPENKPCYAMGLGTPPQLLELVARGVDMFDCVLPTRLARHGTVLTAAGSMNLKNAAFTCDARPIEEGCACPACMRFSRAYVRHLLKAGEILGLRLATLHNLHFCLDLMRRAREAILGGEFESFRRGFLSRWRQD